MSECQAERPSKLEHFVNYSNKWDPGSSIAERDLPCMLRAHGVKNRVLFLWWGLQATMNLDFRMFLMGFDLDISSYLSSTIFFSVRVHES